jgi:hypothetical protein
MRTGAVYLIGDKDITIAILDAWNNEWHAAHLESLVQNENE